MIRGSHEEQVEAVELALSLGINYFDTAPSYGDGKSESNLGKVLSKLEQNIILSSKVWPKTSQLDNLSDVVESSIEASLKRLQRDYVDILYLHSRITLGRESPKWPQSISIQDVLGENGVADVLDDIRRQGKTRFIGFTGLGETNALHRIVESKRFDVVQVYFNLLNPSAGYQVPAEFYAQNFEQIISKSGEHGMGVVAIRVMAAGAVGGEVSRKGYAAPSVDTIVLGGEYEQNQNRSSRLDFLLQGEIQSLPQAALKFVLMHSGVKTALVGFSNLNHIKEAAETTDFNPIPAKIISKVQEIWYQSNRC
jgi:aryl-alcohol dehydrogenase-like predicted oxidoreductase